MKSDYFATWEDMPPYYANIHVGTDSALLVIDDNSEIVVHAWKGVETFDARRHTDGDGTRTIYSGPDFRTAMAAMAASISAHPGYLPRVNWKVK